MSNLPQTASDIFDNLFPLGIQAYPDRIKEINGVVVFSITGESIWVLDATSTPPKITKGAPTDIQNKASVTIEVDSDSFKKMMIDPDAGMDLYWQGKIQISGDTAVALRMRVLFDITRRNPGPAVV